MSKTIQKAQLHWNDDITFRAAPVSGRRRQLCAPEASLSRRAHAERRVAYLRLPRQLAHEPKYTWSGFFPGAAERTRVRMASLASRKRRVSHILTDKEQLPRAGRVWACTARVRAICGRVEEIRYLNE